MLGKWGVSVVKMPVIVLKERLNFRSDQSGVLGDKNINNVIVRHYRCV